MSDLHSIALALGMPDRDPPNLRHYAPPPEVDYQEEEPAAPSSDEQFFLEEQCPSDRHFGR